MLGSPNGGQRLNQFALVSYIPDPLARFLDKLRQELVPDCFLRAHITILGPRPISVPADEAQEEILEAASHFQPLTVELTNIEIFPVSDVIHIAVGAGGDQLRRMHAALNRGHLAYQEPFKYHPHVTLAQNLKPDQVDELSAVAERRWREFRQEKSFKVEVVTFVQNTVREGWLDLGETVLGQKLEPTHPLVLV